MLRALCEGQRKCGAEIWKPPDKLVTQFRVIAHDFCSRIGISSIKRNIFSGIGSLSNAS